MFSPEHRQQVSARLVERAREDGRITGAAITGSAARNAADRYSDVDLFLGVADGVELEDVLSDWSGFVYGELGALHHFDLRGGSATYRAFLLPSLLEIDLGLTPAATFGPIGPGAFRVEFGDAVERRDAPADPGHLIGLGWHHVLHARIAVERDRPWQAEYWISGVRDHTLALACLRLGHPDTYAKGVHLLPAGITDPVQDALVRSLDRDELTRALGAVTRAFLTELRRTDPHLGALLESPLADLAP